MNIRYPCRPPQLAFFLMNASEILPGAVLAWQILNKAEGAGRESSVLERLPGYTMVWVARSPALEAEAEVLSRGAQGGGGAARAAPGCGAFLPPPATAQRPGQDK